LRDGAADPYAPRGDVDIFDVQTGQLAKPQAGIPEDQHHVALSSTGVRQLGDFSCGEIDMSGSPHRRELGSRGWIFRDEPAIIDCVVE